MVDYNRQRKETIKIIDEFASKGRFTTEDICFHVQRATGFSERFITSYIELCIARKFYVKNSAGKISTNPV